MLVEEAQSVAASTLFDGATVTPATIIHDRIGRRVPALAGEHP